MNFGSLYPETCMKKKRMVKKRISVKDTRAQAKNKEEYFTSLYSMPVAV